ncbi:paraquat-inducible protein A [Maricaulis sp.]|uniref:paraquat-inducible protein A n=1 Tax=Maricaulis sp. TaxID=1486257 RepID=UPI0025C4B150|nr:paraquat-inducible protein A [Maricaulis sp.]
MQTQENFRPDALATGLLVIASALLGPGLLLPALETRHLGLWGDEHSILSLGLTLAAEQEWMLALIVLTFSVGFPLAKLGWMWRMQVSDTLPETFRQPGALRWLERLGKWSMADVLVMALVVFSLRGNLMLEARPLIGAYCFALSTILAMLAAGRIIAANRRPAGAS